MEQTVPGTIKLHHGAVVVTLDQLEAALYTLAAYFEETDWDAVTTVIEGAKRCLAFGNRQAPPLLTALAGRAIGPTASQGGKIVEAAYRASGQVRRSWELNHYPQPISPVFKKVHIRAWLLSDQGVSPELFGLDVGWDNWHVNLNQMLAEATGASRVLNSVSVSFPLEVVDQTRFRYDLAPYVVGLARLGIGPLSYLDSLEERPRLAAAPHVADPASHSADRVVAEAVDWFEYRTGNCLRNPSSSVTSAVCYYESLVRFPGMAVSLATYGTDYGRRDMPWEKWSPAYERTGSVISGPVHVFEGRSDEPVMLVNIKRPPGGEGKPVWPAPHTDELRRPFLELATAVSNMLNP